MIIIQLLMIYVLLLLFIYINSSFLYDIRNNFYRWPHAYVVFNKQLSNGLQRKWVYNIQMRYYEQQNDCTRRVYELLLCLRICFAARTKSCSQLNTAN